MVRPPKWWEAWQVAESPGIVLEEAKEMSRRRKKMHRVWGDEGADSVEETTSARGRVASRRDLDAWGDAAGAEMSCDADAVGFDSARKVYFDEWT